MLPDDQIFSTLNLHGLKLRWEEYQPGVFEASFDFPDLTIFLEERTVPWEEGRFVIFAYDKASGDYLHSFPRYYYNLQRAIDEVYEFIDNREKLVKKQLQH